ncbi:MAG: PAS domain-containing protein [bacterium]|nr:MAG: PAS domain-containing protein [bacterium]
MDTDAPRPPGTWLPREKPSSVRRTPFLLLLFVIPLVAIGFLTYRSARVERGLIEESLFRQADALARSLEAGMRTGMMRFALEQNALENLLSETADQAGVLFLGIVGAGGEVAASGGITPGELPSRILSDPPGASGLPDGYFLPGEELFVYRMILAQQGPGGGRGHMGRMGLRRPSPIPSEGSWVLVVLDAEGPLAFRARHQRVTILLGLLLAAAASGFLGWIFWSQRAREVTEALSRTESMARELVRQMPAGLILCGSDGRISIVNPSAEAVLGIPERALLKRKITSIFSPDLLPFDSVLAGQTASIREGLLHRSSGVDLEVSLSATPLPGGEGKVNAVLVLFQDIGELKSLRERVHQAERLAELGRLASTVAHEIRNPLSSIRGFAQLLSGKVSEDHARYTRVLVEEVDRLNRVVGSMLSYARTESPDIRTWPVADILSHVLSLSESDLRSKGVALEIGPVPEGLEWPLDRDMIIQALLNLVINAIEASVPGQTVRLEAEAGKDELTLRVTDEGPGIAEEERERIFDLFYTTREKGTGLGLPLVRKIADLHGGSARISGAGPSGGAVAVLEIPAPAAGDRQ